MSEQNNTNNSNNTQQEKLGIFNIYNVAAVVCLVLIIIAAVLIMGWKNGFLMNSVWDSVNYKWASTYNDKGEYYTTTTEDAKSITVYLYPEDGNYITFDQEMGKTVPTKDDDSIDTEKYDSNATNAKDSIMKINSKLGIAESTYDEIMKAADVKGNPDGDVGEAKGDKASVKWAYKTDKSGVQRLEVTYTKNS